MSGNKLASRKWVEEQMAVSGVSTAAEVKTAYESNANTNAFTDAQKAKVNAIVEVYPTADKNLLTLIKGAAKGDIFVSDGDGSLTKIPVPEVASTFKHSGEADSIPFWSSDEA
jgi:hypothetical protein